MADETTPAPQAAAAPAVSVVVPVFNEAAVLPEFLRRSRAVLDALPGQGHQLVFVDDGSDDGSYELLTAAAAGDPRLVVLGLSRNFGHQAALTCGLDHAEGDAVVVMDADLQDRPEVIPQFLDQLAAGYDVVYARRELRKESLLLRACYFLFYRLIARISSLRLPVDAGDFGLMSRQVVRALRRAPERNRYLRGLRTWAGFHQTGIAVERDARQGGTSKYTFTKLFALACDGIFAFSIAPLRAAAVLGAITLFLSVGFAIYSLIAKFVFGSPQGFTATILVITFLSGMNLFFVGVVGEYVGRIYEEVKARPHYLIRRRHPAPDDEA